MFLQLVICALISGCLATAALAADPAPLQPSPNAFPAVSEPMVVAQDNSCASACQTQHDQCRISTKGSPSCDTARQRCLQACIQSKRSKDR